MGGEGYTCILSPDKKELYASCWGCDKVKVFDTKNKKWLADIYVGDNPNELIITKNGKYLFVCNANDNSVSVIDVKQRTVIETLNTALYPDAPSGSTTNGVALNANEKTLYIANADNNAVAVFDVQTPGNSKPLRIYSRRMVSNQCVSSMEKFLLQMEKDLLLAESLWS
jgi:YVTN family beta-propeller protein